MSENWSNFRCFFKCQKIVEVSENWSDFRQLFQLLFRILVKCFWFRTILQISDNCPISKYCSNYRILFKFQNLVQISKNFQISEYCWNFTRMIKFQNIVQTSYNFSNFENLVEFHTIFQGTDDHSNFRWLLRDSWSKLAEWMDCSCWVHLPVEFKQLNTTHSQGVQPISGAKEQLPGPIIRSHTSSPSNHNRWFSRPIKKEEWILEQQGNVVLIPKRNGGTPFSVPAGIHCEPLWELPLSITTPHHHIYI